MSNDLELDINTVAADTLDSVWRVLRRTSISLSCCTVRPRYQQLLVSQPDDETRWYEAQKRSLVSIKTILGDAVIAVSSKESRAELSKLGFSLLQSKPLSVVVWNRWFPIPTELKAFSGLENSMFLELVRSSTWSEYTGAFLLFSPLADAALLSRFVKQTFSPADNFMAITAWGDAPNWAVLSNRFVQEDLLSFVKASFS